MFQQKDVTNKFIQACLLVITRWRRLSSGLECFQIRGTNCVIVVLRAVIETVLRNLSIVLQQLCCGPSLGFSELWLKTRRAHSEPVVLLL